MWEIRVISHIQLKTALYPALLRNHRRKYQQPALPMQIRCLGLDKAFTVVYSASPLDPSLDKFPTTCVAS